MECAEDSESAAALPPPTTQVPSPLLQAQTWQAQRGRQEVSGAGGHGCVGVRGDDLAQLLALRPLRDQVRGAVLAVDVLKLLNLEPGEGGRWSEFVWEASELPVRLGVSRVPGLG